MLSSKQILYSNRLADESQSINRINAEVIFIVDIKKETDRLIKNGLNFRSIKKPVTFFQEANLRAICYKYYNIGHDKPGICEDRPPIYKIYKKDYSTNNHSYNIVNYKALKGKRCLHDSVKCGNYTNISQKNRHKTSSSSCR